MCENAQCTCHSTLLTSRQQVLKRLFDLLVAVPASIITLPIALTAIGLATIDTKEWGLFSQERIGRNGHPFYIYKIRTMRSSGSVTTTVTTSEDPRITRLGRTLRRYKLDELVQLWNVVRGDMSLVGPRPDVSGWADQLEGGDRMILSVRPGITGPASIAYRNEEQLLAGSSSPEEMNREVIWPNKVRINRKYIETWSIWTDLSMIVRTVFT